MPNLVIIGSGIVGLCIAREAKKKDTFDNVTIIDKEKYPGFHSTSRNSGVIHAGFYYSPDSTKAKFCSEGNSLMREYVVNNSLSYKASGKVVVSKNDQEDRIIEILGKRAVKNNCKVRVLESKLIKNYEPKAKTNNLFLWSPNTWSASPKEILNCLVNEICEYGVKICLGRKVVGTKNKSVILDNGDEIKYDFLINASGGYALPISKLFGIETSYKILPFKGLYLKSKNTNDVFKTHIYPVPDINQPFLGIHTTLTSDNYLKLGPTAIPAFSPENYKIFENLDRKLTPDILFLQSSLFINNNFRFRDLALREFRYLFKENIVKSAQEITNYNLKNINFNWYSPGIRAQLYNLNNQNLENDLIIEFKDSTIHILNSISPAWTCAFKTAQYILNYLNEFLI